MNFRPRATWDVVQQRAALLRQTRSFFDQHGFVEVETPVLSRDVVVDRHLEPFRVPTSHGGEVGWLQTSPEFFMKRMLAAGAGDIYQICRVFRQGESGDWHNPEFTMVEWYRLGDDLDGGMNLLDLLCQALLGRSAAERLSYQECFLRHVGLDPLSATPAEIISAVDRSDIQVPDSLRQGDWDPDAWLDLLMSERIQPALGLTRPALVHSYPASQAALAQLRADDTRVSGRFELFVNGVELANGYDELTDATVLRQRQREANHWRQRDGKPLLPESNRLLEAMEAGLPACAGVAMGLDRVLMLKLGLRRIQDVLAFPFDRA